MKLKSLKLILLLFFISTSLSAQEFYRLDLQKSLEIATEKSYKIKTLKQNLLETEFQLLAATNRFKTQVNLNFVIPNYRETINRFEDSLGVYYSPIKQSSYTGNLEINQPLPTDGRVYLSSGLYGLEDFEIQKNTIQLNTRLGFEQPIEVFYSFNRIQSAFREAELRYEMSKKRMRRATLDLNYEISREFFYLVAALEGEKIAEQTLEMQKEAFEIAQNKYRAGVIAEVEALQMEVDLGEALNTMDIRIADRIAQENLFKQSLGIQLHDSLALDFDLTYAVVEVNEEKAVDLGKKYRLEIREKEIQKELANIDVQRIKVGGQITGLISGYYDFIGVGDDSRSTAISSTFNNAWDELKRRPGNRGVALSISIPLWDWGVSNANVQAALANYKKSDLDLENEQINVERDIRNTVAQLKSSLKRLILLEKNITVAEKSFSISKNRFSNGDINSQSLALDRARLNQAYISRLNAFISYKLMLADLMRKTFYDFEQNKLMIEN